MPVIWTNADYRKAFLATLLPTSVGIAGIALIGDDAKLKSFAKNLRLPSWTFQNVLAHAGVDLAVVAPLGYASYLVYKDGGGFDYTDTTVALSFYGLNLAGMATFIHAFKSQKLKYIAGVSVANALTAAGVTIAFAGISKKAAWLALPYAIWSVYYAAVMVKIQQNNKSVVQLD